MMQPLRVGLFLLFVVSCGRQDSAANRPAGAAPRGDTAVAAIVWTVRPDSFGPIPLGAPLADAVAALRDSLPIDPTRLDGCAMARVSAMPRGTSLMVLRDSAGAPIRVDRVDVDTAGVRTREGAGVGDAEASVVEMYRGRVRVEPHKYTGPRGHYLVVENPADTLHRLVFETDGQRVLRYHAGRRPAVDLVERCG